MGRGPGRNDLCPCGSGRKFKKCCLDKIRQAAYVGDPGVDDPLAPSQAFTLVVETDAGPLVRCVPDASPLRSDMRAGTAAEIATSDAAAIWGLPDFVFQSELRKLGSGSRELGDGIVVVGDIGLAVQVKCREAAVADLAKERRWAEKKAAHALSQAVGTIRLLRQSPAQLTNRRGRIVTIDAPAIRWIPVAVLDHPHLPAADGVTPDVRGTTPGVVLLRRDWEFLFDQLKSTGAVAGYLARVAGEPLPLGNEPMRYYDLAQADERTAPGPRDPDAFGGRGRHISTPLLPMQPAKAAAHRMMRLILEDIAVADPQGASENYRLGLLAELDLIPVGHREATGRFLLDALKVVAEPAPGETIWRLRRMAGPESSVLLGFGACSTPMDAGIRAAFGAWAHLRHYEMQQDRGMIDDLTTIAILLTPRYDGVRPWDTTLVVLHGDLQITKDELDQFEAMWKRGADVPDIPFV